MLLEASLRDYDVQLCKYILVAFAFAFAKVKRKKSEKSVIQYMIHVLVLPCTRGTLTFKHIR